MTEYSDKELVRPNLFEKIRQFRTDKPSVLTWFRMDKRKAPCPIDTRIFEVNRKEISNKIPLNEVNVRVTKAEFKTQNF